MRDIVWLQQVATRYRSPNWLVGHDERKLVDRAKIYDQEWFGDLYDRHFLRIYKFVYSRVRNQSGAESQHWPLPRTQGGRYSRWTRSALARRPSLPP